MKEVIFEKNTKKFFYSLEKTTIYKGLRIIELLEKYEHLLEMPFSKKLFNNCFELRIRGQQEIRLIYVFCKEKIVIIHGFIKKVDKIPEREIKTILGRIKRFEIL